MSMTLAPGVTGAQRPPFLHLPTSANPALGSLGGELIDLADLANIPLDPWQAWIAEEAHTLRDETFWNPYTERTEHKWAAYEVVCEVCRQNGKSLLAEARQLAGLFIWGERLIVHSAHKWDTVKETFTHIFEVIQDCPDLDRKLVRVTQGNGERGIHVRARKGAPIQRLVFRTRGGTAGGGRGFTGDTTFVDEAMFLTSEQIAALYPTMGARPNPQLWLLGSAGNRLSVGFGRSRRRVLADDPEEDRLFGALWEARLCNEWCEPNCTEHDDPASPETWLKVNPSIGVRTKGSALTIDFLRAEYKSMNAKYDITEFGAEHLGVGDWPVEEDGWLVISKDEWSAAHNATSCIERGKPLVLAVAVPPDRKWTCIGAVGPNPDGLIHGELTAKGIAPGDWDYRPGQQWAIKRIKDLWIAQRPAFVVIDKSTPAGTMIAELEDAGIKVVSPSAREYAQACGDLRSAIVPRPGEKRMFVHLDQEPLSKAVGGADKRTLTGLWAWMHAGTDISPIEAMTLGWWGYKEFLYGDKAAADPWVAWG